MYRNIINRQNETNTDELLTNVQFDCASAFFPSSKFRQIFNVLILILDHYDTSTFMRKSKEW